MLFILTMKLAIFVVVEVEHHGVGGALRVRRLTTVCGSRSSRVQWFFLIRKRSWLGGSVLTLLSLTLVVTMLVRNAGVRSISRCCLARVSSVAPRDRAIFVDVHYSAMLRGCSRLSGILRSSGCIPRGNIVLPRARCILEPNSAIFSVLSETMECGGVRVRCRNTSGGDCNDMCIRNVGCLCRFSYKPLSN